MSQAPTVQPPSATNKSAACSALHPPAAAAGTEGASAKCLSCSAWHKALAPGTCTRRQHTPLSLGNVGKQTPLVQPQSLSNYQPLGNGAAALSQEEHLGCQSVVNEQDPNPAHGPIQVILLMFSNPFIRKGLAWWRRHSPKLGKTVSRPARAELGDDCVGWAGLRSDALYFLCSAVDHVPRADTYMRT